jgi:hypothetical protein
VSSYAAQLRSDLTERAVAYAQANGHITRRSNLEFGSVIFRPAFDNRSHGNFHPASYRAIMARPRWRRRLSKVLTVPERLTRVDDDHRLCELDSCCSSDALLMNIFCHPQVASSSAVQNLLAMDGEASPIFGWRARVPLKDGNVDRTEVDMRFGNLLVEAKLTEGSFEACAVERMKNYARFEAVFRRGELPRMRRQYKCYQLLRNVLAADAHNASFCLLTDARRPDLMESWFRVLAAVRPLDLRLRCKLLTWQELAAALPSTLQSFLDKKYGIACSP